MTDPWDVWDERVFQVGRLTRVAEELTDEEIVCLIARESAGRREIEKRVLKDELLGRLHRGSRRTSESVEEPVEEASRNA
ncbi:MAG TPA: hypothetical protein VNZ52_08080 [Candidatus Thermoplasmatota archaeon]|nr:hypothetical protein [Candidatus Thermoplasmatota archaeon]